MSQIDKEFGEHEFGVKVHTRSHWHYTPSKHVSTTPFCPLSGPNKFVVSIKPGYEMPKEIEVSNRTCSAITFNLFAVHIDRQIVREIGTSSISSSIIRQILRGGIRPTLDVRSSEELTETETETYRKHYKE
jgi:hypothetical protein